MADTANERFILPRIETSNVGSITANSQETALVPSGQAEPYRIARTDQKVHAKSKASGQLDTWPAHPLRPAGSNLSLGNAASYNQHQTDSSQVAKVIRNKEGIVPKPKFLEHLESYLSKELRLLGCSPHGPSELRLQAHREAFEYLINEFKTYKPIMSTIKNEYELYIEQLQATLLRLKPLEVRRSLSTTTYVYHPLSPILVPLTFIAIRSLLALFIPHCKVIISAISVIIVTITAITMSIITTFTVPLHKYIC
jgi:hypothetical protein